MVDYDTCSLFYQKTLTYLKLLSQKKIFKHKLIIDSSILNN